MANLIIVGNGFDMAHGLKTSYYDFILYLINTKINSKNNFNNLFSFKIVPKDYRELKNMVSEFGINEVIKSDNIFFKTLLQNSINKNWYDIEQFYYDVLLYTIDKKTTRAEEFGIEKLNLDFEQIKKLLETYLTNQQKIISPLKSINDFFNQIINNKKSHRNDLILNFNYTNTLKNYSNINSAFDIMHIHGKLNDDKNPIIFGYAANLSENRTLLKQNNYNYLTNIKKHNYKMTRHEEVLKVYLEYKEPLNVFVLGHSIGLSDKLILNDILNSTFVKKINIFYYKNHLNFFKTQVNIDRIMDNDKNFEKLESFEKALRMPQFNDTKKLVDRFSIKLKNL
jgi:hypothetical protein